MISHSLLGLTPGEATAASDLHSGSAVAPVCVAHTARVPALVPGKARLACVDTACRAGHAASEQPGLAALSFTSLVRSPICSRAHSSPPNTDPAALRRPAPRRRPGLKSSIYLLQPQPGNKGFIVRLQGQGGDTKASLLPQSGSGAVGQAGRGPPPSAPACPLSPFRVTHQPGGSGDVPLSQKRCRRSRPRRGAGCRLPRRSCR